MKRSDLWSNAIGRDPSFSLFGCRAFYTALVWKLRTELTHDFSQIDANSPESRSFLIELPVGELASSDASLSALSWPVMPQWLGIQYNEVAVPLDLRHSIWFLIAFRQRFLGNRGDSKALIADRESEKIWLCSGVGSKE